MKPLLFLIACISTQAFSGGVQVRPLYGTQEYYRQAPIQQPVQVQPLYNTYEYNRQEAVRTMPSYETPHYDTFQAPTAGTDVFALPNANSLGF